MKRAYLAALLLVIAGASTLGLMALLPFAKEGSSWGDLPIFAGAVAAALILGFLWWLAVGRSFPKSLIGWSLLLLPLIGHGWTLTLLTIARFEGWRLAQIVLITDYQEKDIVWPGFDGPIGLEISLELGHPASLDAVILPPEIRMGPKLDIPRDRLSASFTSGSGYFKNTYLEVPAGDLTLLKAILFQRVFENPTVDHPVHKWTASARFDGSARTHQTYFLLPGALDYVPERNRICLSSRSYGIAVCSKDQKPETGCVSPNYRRAAEPVYFEGQDLSAIWMAAGSYDMTADLSRQITEILRKRSRLQSDPAAWRAIQKRLEPEGLTKAGYRLCPAGKDSHTSFRTCYCKTG